MAVINQVTNMGASSGKLRYAKGSGTTSSDGVITVIGLGFKPCAIAVTGERISTTIFYEEALKVEVIAQPGGSYNRTYFDGKFDEEHYYPYPNTYDVYTLLEDGFICEKYSSNIHGNKIVEWIAIGI